MTVVDEKAMYAMLLKRVPALMRGLHMQKVHCPYKMAAFFATFTRTLMKSGYTEAVHACFDTAEELLRRGNQPIRTAIENVYLFSVSQNGYFTRELQDQLPPLLKWEYLRQVNASSK